MRPDVMRKNQFISAASIVIGWCTHDALQKKHSFCGKKPNLTPDFSICPILPICRVETSIIKSALNQFCDTGQGKTGQLGTAIS